MEFDRRADQFVNYINTAGFATMPQLLTLFSTYHDSKEVVPKMVQYYAGAQQVVIKNGIIRSTHFKSMTEDAVKKRVQALYPVASLGINNIIRIDVTKPPVLYYVQAVNPVTKNITAYDFAVINDITEAVLAVQVRKIYSIIDEKDMVNHIAIVKDQETGRKILPYFDSYCIITPQGKVAFFRS